jgi:hypothetical protein
MALPAYAQVTLAEFKRYAPLMSTGKDTECEEAIARASLRVEQEGLGGRRVVYRGPAEVEGAGNIVASRTLADETVPGGALTQPSSEGRTLIVTVTDADRSVTAGTVTVTGTVGGVAAQTEVFDLAAGGLVQHGVKFFTAISSIVVAVTNEGAGDTLKIGSSVGMTEFYSPYGGCSEVVPIEWPILYVAELREDVSRTFPASSALTEGTHFEIRRRSTNQRALARISGAISFPFYSGYRVVRGRMSCGYRSAAAVPQAIKDVCLHLGAWDLFHSLGRQYGLSSVSDAAGNRSFSGPPMLTTGMKEALDAYRRPEFGLTAERDFDLVDA